MRELALVVLCLIDVFPSCGKRPRPVPVAIVAGTPDKPRDVDITVSNQGYTPKEVMGRPGETLRLVFHYEASARECGREVVLPKDNVRVTLTDKQPVAVTTQLPAAPGEVVWSCGMDMLHGKIVVQ
jgi:plastocyanin domain-containing protein